MITNFNEIKAKTDIVEFIGSYVKLKKRGANHIGLCPFHNENSPSFHVSLSKGIFKCFGCGKSGDVFDFYKRHERKTHLEAIEFIASHYNFKPEYDKQKVFEKPIPRLEKIRPEYIKWFESRGISNNTLLRLSITESIEWMPEAEKEVPVICFNYYRGEKLINIKYRGKNKDFKLNKGSEIILYNINSIIGENEAVIVEGEMDTLALHEAGIYNSVSVPNGASKSGNNNLQYIENCIDDLNGISKFILFTDNDTPGKTLIDELAFRLGKKKCFIVVYPEGCKDANDILVKHGPEFLRLLVYDAKPVIKPELTPGSFPLEVFGTDIGASFRELSDEFSVPLDYFGVTALFTIAAMSGSMYKTVIPIQNIIFGILIGPSGVGKSPAYNILCGDIIEPMEQELFDHWTRSLKEWEEKKQDAKRANQSFKEPKPLRRIRTAKGGTMEGIMSHAMTSPAGFGLYYDEGGKMLGSPNQFKKDNSSIDFWNEIWNGKYFNELRADSELERFASKTRISVLIGMQTDRIRNYFTQDATDSGLTYRFLFTVSDYIQLNEFVDHFSDRRQPSMEWQNIVRYLFKKGAYNYFKDDEPQQVEFFGNAAEEYNRLCSQLIEGSNALRESKRVGDCDEMILTYQSKLYHYFGRFCLVLAIIDRPDLPTITEKHVHNAYKLYLFFHDQAAILFKRLSRDQANDLSENEARMYDALPDREFTREDINRISLDLKMSEKFFDTAFRRKFKDGWIRRVSKGKYLKDN